MRTISAHMATAGISFLLLATTLPAQTTDGVSSSAVSKVRIVRLSEVRGDVQLDRDTGRGYEPAMANLPIVEKSRLQTGKGAAEVEFEDNSTLRVAPYSLVEFPQLERLQVTGMTASSVRLVKGMAYVSLLKTKGNEFNLLFGPEKLQLPPDSHIRLQLDGTEAKFAVLDGTVRIEGPGGAMDVSKKKTVTFPLQDQGQPTIAKNIEADPFDSWDKDAAGYHARTAAASTFGNSPYSYGLNDMMYYGSFMNAGGCGSMWRPYFASAAWDPYANGAWAYYQGAGYSWVSPYPWGWTPFHYGSWAFCPGAGWGWQPGGSWSGLNNTVLIATSKPGTGHPIPVAPPHPPRGTEPTITAVNQKPLVLSSVSTSNSFVFRKDSAGLGIPRDTLGKLGKFSQQTVTRGTASATIYVSTAAPAGGRAGNESIAPISIHRGSPPPPSQGIGSLSSRGSVSGAGSVSSMGSGNASRSGPAPSAPAPSSPRGH